MKTADTIKRRLWDVFSCGFPFDYDLKVLRKAFLINMIIILGTCFLMLLGAMALIQGNPVLGMADFSVVIFLSWLFLFLRKTKKLNTGSVIGTSAIGAFYAFLIAYGGVSNTAYVWAFTYPLIVFFGLGTGLGAVLSLLLLVVACAVFFFGKSIAFLATYDGNLILRFIPAYITICLFSFVIEKVSEKVHSRLRVSNTEMEKAIKELEKADTEKEKLIDELRKTVREVTILQGILPMCASCKKIRNDAGYWERVEEYIQQRSQAQFSHGICPECMKKLYPDYPGVADSGGTE